MSLERRLLGVPVNRQVAVGQRQGEGRDGLFHQSETLLEVTRVNRHLAEAVEGDGVVGKCPRLEPGESFSYHSFHLNDTTTAVAEGSYIGIDEKGRKVLTRIPKFEMDAGE